MVLVSTHDPIIAAQFDPAERLVWQGNGYAPSTAAPDADLVEILRTDFGIE